MAHGLNPDQAAAVAYRRGPLLVLAGAGSGKTRVITERIAALLGDGVRPERILAVSFTNKAAAEMRERMIPLVGRERADALWLSTFHSFGVRFLRQENRALGYDGRFVIFDQGDCLGMVKEILRREHPQMRKLDVASLMTRISLWKNAFKRPEEIPASTFEYDEIARQIYPVYERTLASMRAVDFDDLVVAPVRILSEREDIRHKWRERFAHLMIDEFQDTNRSQLELVRLLANDQQNVCVVGDDDQSIYGWRGAEVGNILEFEQHFRGPRPVEVVKLVTNYRSRKPILDIANASIAQSRGKRHDKALVAARGEGDRVRMVTSSDVEQEARFVAKEIKHLREENVGFGQIAVLYRSNQQAKLIEEELRMADIPHRMFGGTQFFDRKEIKDVIAYLRVIVNPRDELSLRRIVNYPPRGLGETSLERLHAHATLKGMSLLEAIRRADEIDDLTAPAKRGAEALTRALDQARRSFRARESLRQTVGRLLEDVGLIASMSGADKDSQRRRENLRHFFRSIERYEGNRSANKPTLGQFLTRISLRVDGEGDEDAPKAQVTLSSLHSAKGLEFDYVFFIGCVEGTIPHARTLDPKVTEAAPTDIDEERRLFYVGVTRARERLYLTRPVRKVIRGRTVPVTPSRFLGGLPDDAWEPYSLPEQAPVSMKSAASHAEKILEMLAKNS